MAADSFMESNASADGSTWPLVGRERELSRTRRAVAIGASVLFMGGSGVGRSALLTRAQELAIEGGADVVRVGVTPGRPDGPPISAGGWLDSYAAKVHPVRPVNRGAAGPKRRVLVVDDAHLLDSASAVMLHHLVSFGAITVLATARSDRLLPDGLNQLWVQRLAERIDVSVLDRAAVAELLAAVLRGAVEADSADRLWRVTGGNALLLRELVESELAEGSLRRRAGLWSWDGECRCDGRLGDLVRLQLGTLRPEESDLVNMVALAEPLNANLPSVSALSETAERLCERGVLIADGTASGLRLRFAYPIFGQVLVSSMSQLARWRLGGLLADELERTSVDEDLLHAIGLRRDTGRQPDADLLLAGATAALQRQDFRLAEELCMLTAAPGQLPRVARVALVLGRALAGQRRYAEAEAAYAAVDRVSAAAADLDEIARSRALNLAWGLHRVGDAVELLDRATPGAALDDVHTLHATKAMLWIIDDRLHEVAEQGRSVLRGEAGDSRSAQVVIPPAALAHMEFGDAAGALALLGHCRHRLEHWEPEPRRFHHVMTLAAAFLMGRTGEMSAAMEELDRTEQPGAAQPPVAAVRARILRSRGRFAEAIRLLRHAIAPAREIYLFTSRAWMLAQLAGTLAEGGYHAEALRVLDEAHAAQQAAQPFPIATHGVSMETALVRAHVGDVAAARRQARALAGHCAEIGRPAQELAALHLAARLGDAQAVGDRAAALAGQASSRLMHLQAEHVYGLAARDPSALASAAARWGEFGWEPLAAEACAQALRAYREAGRRREHRAAVAACRQSLARYAGAVPGWAHGESRDTQTLTVRELQVATLAAGGSTNQDIASRLVVSIRTVENHLQRAYAKLGVTGRAELAGSLGL
jgi:DNA-binding NarL/FixJ family response regulator